MRTRSPDDGFTLIELLIAISIIAVVLASVAPLFATAMAAGTAARRRAVASLLAAEMLEQLCATSELADGESVDYLDADGEAIDARRAMYTRRARVRAGAMFVLDIVVTAGGVEVARLATARVRWTP